MSKLTRGIKSVLGKDDGLVLLKMLKEMYVDVVALDPEPTIMAYKLGQKELIQYLISEVNMDETLDKIETHQFEI